MSTNTIEMPKPRISKFGGVARKAVRVSEEVLVKVGQLTDGKLLPLVIQPAVHGVSLISWATNNRDFIETNLRKHGGILLRKFVLQGSDEFEQFIAAVSGQVL